MMKQVDGLGWALANARTETLSALACPVSRGGAHSERWLPLAILVRVLTFVRLVLPDDTPRRGARGSVSSHVPRDSAH